MKSEAARQPARRFFLARRSGETSPASSRPASATNVVVRRPAAWPWVSLIETDDGSRRESESEPQEDIGASGIERHHRGDRKRG